MSSTSTKPRLMYQGKKLHLTFTGLNNSLWISVSHGKANTACGFGFFWFVLSQIAWKVGEIPKEKAGLNLNPFVRIDFTGPYQPQTGHLSMGPRAQVQSLFKLRHWHTGLQPCPLRMPTSQPCFEFWLWTPWRGQVHSSLVGPVAQCLVLVFRSPQVVPWLASLCWGHPCLLPWHLSCSYPALAADTS